MRARVLLAGLAVVLSASACGSSDASGSPSSQPTVNCTPTTAPTPAAGVKESLGEVLLISTDPGCGAAQVSVSAAGITPAGASVPVGSTVAFSFASAVTGFRVGLEAARDVAAGTVLVYRFDAQERYYITVGGPVVGEVTVGSPTGGPADLPTRPAG